jgi:hypothetical protein
VTFYEGDSCKMGSTVVRGEVEATVEHTGADTFFGKTASLLASSGEHSHLQKVLMRIMIVLVVLSVTLCGASFAYLLSGGVPLRDALSFTVVLLVASIPLAIEIVTNATLAIGSKALAKRGAIVARLSAIEDMAGMSILCSDKTGTLTLNKMVLQDETPTYCPGETRETVLVYAALAAKWKEPPRDALDRLTLGSVNMDLLVDYEQTGKFWEDAVKKHISFVLSLSSVLSLTRLSPSFSRCVLRVRPLRPEIQTHGGHPPQQEDGRAAQDHQGRAAHHPGIVEGYREGGEGAGRGGGREIRRDGNPHPGRREDGGAQWRVEDDGSTDLLGPSTPRHQTDDHRCQQVR